MQKMLRGRTVSSFLRLSAMEALATQRVTRVYAQRFDTRPSVAYAKYFKELDVLSLSIQSSNQLFIKRNLKEAKKKGKIL